MDPLRNLMDLSGCALEIIKLLNAPISAILYDRNTTGRVVIVTCCQGREVCGMLRDVWTRRRSLGAFKHHSDIRAVTMEMFEEYSLCNIPRCIIFAGGGTHIYDWEIPGR